MRQSKLSRTLFANWSTIMTTACATLAMSGVVLFTELHPAWGQQAAVISRSSDGPGGEGAQVFIMPAIPNRFDALVRPDFGRRDMPLFKENLELDESQMYVLEVLVDGYTEQFQSAVDEFRSVQKRYRLQIPGMDGEMLGGPMMEGDFLGDMMVVDENEDGMHIIDLGDDMTFVMESPGSIEIGVTRSVNIDTDVDVTSEDGGEPTVSVAFVAADENGESLLTDEQIKAITERISEQIKERMAEVEARRAEIEARRAAREAAREADPNLPAEEVEPATADEVAKAGRALITERNRLRDELVGDVTMLLSDDQKTKWPTFDRTHRRASTMRFAEYGGERVDLLQLLNEQQPKVEDEAGFALAKAQYEVELDQALKTRNDLLPEYEIEVLLMTDAMIQSQSFDDEDRLSLMDRVGDARAAVRDVNLNTVNVIEPLLADDARKDFRETVMRKAYPHIYGGTSTERSLEAAMKFEDIDAETRTAIETLAADYKMQVAALNDRMAETIRKSEPRRHREMMAQMDKMREMEMQREEGGKMDFDFGPDPEGELRQQKRELNKRTIDQLHGMLTPEQIEQLPKLRRRLPFFSGPDGAPMPPPGGGGVRVIKTESRPD